MDQPLHFPQQAPETHFITPLFHIYPKVKGLSSNFCFEWDLYAVHTKYIDIHSYKLPCIGPGQKN